MLRRLDGSAFATGMSLYLDEDPRHPSRTARIHVKFEFDGETVFALLDTGASWSVLNAELAQVESTVFVSPEWPEGNFIGYSGLLERIRFAIDPGSNSFVFGAL